MMTNYLRKLIRRELQAVEHDIAKHLADLIARNNEKIEDDLVELGVLERDKNGQLQLKTRSS